MHPLLLSVALAADIPADVLPARGAPADLLHAQLLPLGFSPDGKLAVLHLPPDEALDCFPWHFQVIDLNTDDVIAAEQWDLSRCDETPDLEALWDQHDGFARHLASHGIQPAPLALRSFPIQHDGAPVGARLVTQIPTRYAAEDTWSVPVSLVLGEPGQGAPVGTVAVSVMHGLPLTWGHEVLGGLLSPHEDRVAVIVRGRQQGWDGPPHVETVHIFGAPLSGYNLHRQRSP